MKKTIAIMILAKGLMFFGFLLMGLAVYHYSEMGYITEKTVNSAYGINTAIQGDDPEKYKSEKKEFFDFFDDLISERRIGLLFASYDTGDLVGTGLELYDKLPDEVAGATEENQALLRRYVDEGDIVLKNSFKPVLSYVLIIIGFVLDMLTVIFVFKNKKQK